MKRPIILEGKPFDWDEGKRYGAQAVDDDGNVNWMAAMFADPGVMACPGCGEHLWNEGMTAKCPDCEHEWRTPNGVHVDARKKPKTDLPALIAEVRRLDAEATKGPWFYNSYSGVFSEPVSREYDVAVEALPDDAPAEAFDGLVEPCCAHVPVVGGDTATAQGARDAALIAAYRTAAPLLAAECERLRDILAAVAAPLSIDGENHAATVMHARAALESMPLKRKGRT